MFNVIFAVYNPPKELLDMHILQWKNIPLQYRKRIRFIIVDDCSSNPVTLDIDFPINLTLVRIDTDIFWNPPGAKNLGFMLYDSCWCFSCDIDHIVESDEYIKMLALDKQIGNVYFFERFKPDGTSRGKNTPNIFIIHKNDFWKTGGYDEDFSGAHGYDDYVFMGDFYKPNLPSLIKNAGIKFIQTDIKIVEHAFPAADRAKKVSTHHISEPMMQRKLQELINGTYIHSDIIRFDWHIVKELKI